MSIYLLDGKDMKDRETAYDVIAEALDLPEWFGRNLDALYDCLTELGEEQAAVFVNTAELISALGDYGESMLACFRDASEAAGFTFIEKE